MLGSYPQSLSLFDLRVSHSNETMPHRLPPPLANVPTDAEYAMDLISQRVARGLPILPPKSYTPSRRSSDTESVRSLNVQNKEGLRQRFFGDENSKSVDWKKWGERAATSKAWADSVRGQSSGRVRVLLPHMSNFGTIGLIYGWSSRQTVACLLRPSSATIRPHK